MADNINHDHIRQLPLYYITVEILHSGQSRYCFFGSLLLLMLLLLLLLLLRRSLSLEVSCYSHDRCRQGDLVGLLDDLLPQPLQQGLVLVRREVEAIDERLADAVELVLSVRVVQGEDPFVVDLGGDVSVPDEGQSSFLELGFLFIDCSFDKSYSRCHLL